MCLYVSVCVSVCVCVSETATVAGFSHCVFKTVCNRMCVVPVDSRL